MKPWRRLRKAMYEQSHNSRMLTSSAVTMFVKNVINDPSFKTVVKIGFDVATNVVPFVEKPSKWAAAKAVFSICKSLVDSFEFYAGDFFDDTNVWIEPYTSDFAATILDVVKGYPKKVLKTSSDNIVINLVDIGDDIVVGWRSSTKTNWGTDQVFVRTESREPARKRLKELLWKQYGHKPVILTKNVSFDLRANKRNVVLKVDDSFEHMPSALADEYTTYLGKCFAAGVNRSVMLYGPPGTGKSTLARQIVSELKLKSFRIRLDDINMLDLSTLFEAIEIFEPDAVLFDDFDRLKNQESLLETLEYFQKRVKLVVATINHREALDEALMRPGRFDELIHVKRMDDNVIMKMLGEENGDMFETVKEWPIAFIHELVKRLRFMSKDEAVNSIKELTERVERIDEYEKNPNRKMFDRVPRALGSNGHRPPIDPDDMVDDV